MLQGWELLTKNQDKFYRSNSKNELQDKMKAIQFLILIVCKFCTNCFLFSLFSSPQFHRSLASSRGVFSAQQPINIRACFAHRPEYIECLRFQMFVILWLPFSFHNIHFVPLIYLNSLKLRRSSLLCYVAHVIITIITMIT